MTGPEGTPPGLAPRKLVVLGGGLAALSAVFALTEQPGWQQRHDITVYQIGWRLGGKARSGRNLRAHARSEGLGHHVWYGWYDNAFALVRRLYDKLKRPAGAPLAGWKEAFRPGDTLLLGTGAEPGVRRATWPITLPRTADSPGDGAAPPSVWGFAQILLLWAIDCIPRLHPDFPDYAAIVPRWPDSARNLLPALLRRAAGQGVRAYDGFDPQSPDYDGLLRRAAAAFDGPDAPQTSRQRRAWAQPLTHFAEHSLRALLPAAREHQPHFTTLVDLGLAVVRGILHDGLDRAGFSAIDDQELRAWLRRHGAADVSLDSPLLAALYADHLSYESGDPARPIAAAGALLRSGLRRFLGYHGALYYTPTAGLGEILFAPLYRVLRDRGVRFRFFHKLKQIRLDPARPTIAALVLGRQVELAPGHEDYDPLIKVKGLPCWPHRPLYGQIVLGDDPVIQAIDFESQDSPEVEEVVLREGADFDDVLLAIPPPALLRSARELAAREPRWQAALERTRSVAAMGAQLWLTPTWAQLAGGPARAAVGVLARTDLPRWANLTSTVSYEAWPRELWPGTAAAIGGPRPDPAPGEGTTREHVRDVALTWLKGHPRAMWPEASLPDGAELNWELLIDPQGRAAEHRLAAQHCWSSSNPSDRQIVTLPGDARHRLPTTGAGFDNLVLAGDWVGGGLDIACAEAAVISGLQAARALGAAVSIVGERDLVDAE